MINTEVLQKAFVHQPTVEQIELFRLLDIFLNTNTPNSTFILRGYAGTGKTTSVIALVKLLPLYKLKPILLAPTGRATKVLSNYTKQPASTIHKKIYKKKDQSDILSAFVRSTNPHSHTVFIVDEASMISDQHDGSSFTNNSLLNDLVKYVFNNKNCKLILIGDDAQLPPVGLTHSPALDAQYLTDYLDLDVMEMELTEVLRQHKDSGILENANQLRALIKDKIETIPCINTKGYKDIYRMTSDKIVDGLTYAYNKYGMEETMLITRSNKTANIYNQKIRSVILNKEDELCTGDYLMVVKNNYFWLPETSNHGFIANGDIAIVKKIRRSEIKLHGLRFAEVDIFFPDYPEDGDLTCKIVLDTLTENTPNLSPAKSKELYESVLMDYMDVSNKTERYKKTKADSYYNAIQVKFAYAVTCHKAQGGQWDAVFIEQDYLTQEMINLDFLRWLYTAITRSKKELFLINFNDAFFNQKEN